MDQEFAPPLNSDDGQVRRFDAQAKHLDGLPLVSAVLR
jgi:hypothetical protein